MRIPMNSPIAVASSPGCPEPPWGRLAAPFTYYLHIIYLFVTYFLSIFYIFFVYFLPIFYVFIRHWAARRSQEAAQELSFAAQVRLEVPQFAAAVAAGGAQIPVTARGTSGYWGHRWALEEKLIGDALH